MTEHEQAMKKFFAELSEYVDSQHEVNRLTLNAIKSLNTSISSLEKRLGDLDGK